MIAVSTKGLERLDDDVRRFGDKANLAAQLAINDTLAWSRTRLKVQMKAQINLTESAFSGKHFFISQYARRGSLQGVLSAGTQGYSLSRFSVEKPRVGVKGVSVQVAGGAVRKINRGFFIRAPNGALGLAIRSKAQPTGSRGAKESRKHKGLWILFGPSPDQLMRRLAPDSLPDVGRHVGAEYARQLNRLISNG
jgi:hypothetical protein